MFTSTSSTTPAPNPSVALTWPFLKSDSSPSPTNPTPDLVYRATGEGDLRLFLEIVRSNPYLVNRVTKIFLVEEYDNMWDSEVLEFVNEYTVAVNTANQDDGEGYETEAVQTDTEHDSDSQVADDESDEDKVSQTPTSPPSSSTHPN